MSGWSALRAEAKRKGRSTQEVLSGRDRWATPWTNDRDAEKFARTKFNTLMANRLHPVLGVQLTALVLPLCDFGYRLCDVAEGLQDLLLKRRELAVVLRELFVDRVGDSFERGYGIDSSSGHSSTPSGRPASSDLAPAAGCPRQETPAAGGLSTHESEHESEEA